MCKRRWSLKLATPRYAAHHRTLHVNCCHRYNSSSSLHEKFSRDTTVALVGMEDCGLLSNGLRKETLINFRRKTAHITLMKMEKFKGLDGTKIPSNS